MTSSTSRPIDVVRERLTVVHGEPLAFRDRCPAHGSNGGTLAVRENRAGAVLLKCHAGCSAGEITRAIGLELRNLFPSADGWRERQAQLARDRARPPVAGEVERAVEHELERVLRAEEGTLGFRPAVLSRHLALARRRAGDRFGLKLRPPTTVWYELEPLATDPLFRLCVDRALEERAWMCSIDVALVNRACERNPRVADAVLGDAVRMLREAVNA